MEEYIEIKGARVNNLKNLTLRIPRGKFVVITGISGSGKSSLAFDTLYAEGQRRFSESLSSYARQFLGRMTKPDVDLIDGIPPAIAIEQKVSVKNPRSTVGTTTEIYDFLRLVFSRIGRTYSPVSGREVKADSVQDVLRYLEESGATTFYILADVRWDWRDDKVELILSLKEQGYSRMFAEGRIWSLDDILSSGRYPQGAMLLIDRLRIEDPALVATDADLRTRLLQSVGDAFDKGNGDIAVACNAKESGNVPFSEALPKLSASESGDVPFSEALPKFSAGEKGTSSDPFSKPLDKSLTLQYITGARPRYLRQKRSWNYAISVEGAMEHNLKDITVKFPLRVLTVVTGVSGSGKSSLVGDILYPALSRTLNDSGGVPGTHKGLGGNLDRISRVEYVDQNPIGKSTRSNAVTYLKVYDEIRKLLSEQQYAKVNGYGPSFFSFNQDGGRCPECQGEGVVTIGMQFMADVTMVCEECGGKRFKPDILEVRYRGKNIDDILSMSVEQAIEFFSLGREEAAQSIARKLQPLVDVGLGYIGLGQSSSTLSGGESQRIKLAYFLSLSREGGRKAKERILFIFDEPTTGLHFFDVEKLLASFDALLDAGHSIVVVEHNLDVIRNADWVIDLGPDAGDRGGEVVFEGTPEKMPEADTFTARYLREN